MKFPVSDQFLWDIFASISNIEDTLRFLVHPPKTWGQVFWDTNNPIYQKYYKKMKSKQFSRFIYYLKINNLIRVQSLRGNVSLMLTKKGFDKAVRAQFKFARDKRKDGKWIMVIFDVPEKWRKSRKLLRSILLNLGYKKFQQSVWITPYDVFEKTEFLLQEYSLDEFVRIFLIEEI